MTRYETTQLAIVLQHLRTGQQSFSSALAVMLDLVERVAREQEREDQVNAALEQSAKGTGDDKQRRI